VEAAREAEGLVTDRTDPDFVRRLWTATGRALTAAGDPDAALDYAARLRDLPGGRARADAALVKGEALDRQNEAEAALDLLAEAARRYGDLGDRAGRAAALVLAGQSHQGAGSHDKASDAYEQAEALYEALYEALGDAAGLASVARGRGIVHAMRGEFAEAEPLFRRALEAWERTGDEREIGRALQSLSALYFDAAAL
jgi:tetratricopeptide (TPR) repeat protein